MSARVAALVACSAALVATACGVPTGDSSFDEIPPAEIPVDLRSTTTTSTTTTTTTVPDAPQTTAQTTTTLIALAPVEVYFLSGGRLQDVSFELPRGFGPTQVKDLLEAGPPRGSAGVGLESLIDEGLIVDIKEAGGVLTIDLDPVVFDEIRSFEQSEALGQIVLTMTSSVPRAGQVLFTIGGEPTPVKKGDSQLADEGEPVAYDDYRVLTVGPESAATTSTTTTAPPETTTEPTTTEPATESTTETVSTTE